MKKAIEIKLTTKEEKELDKLVRSVKTEKRLSFRAQIILLSAQGKESQEIAKILNTRNNTVGKWRNKFAKRRMEGIKDAPRCGAPTVYGEDFRNNLLKKLSDPPPTGFAKWDAALLMKELDASDDAIWRYLKKEGIRLTKNHSWCISNDPNFVEKSADIIGLYLNPPERALVISVDEKPAIQAIEREQGYVKIKREHKKETKEEIIRGYDYTYERHGTSNLFAALNVATGQIEKLAHKNKKKREDFLDFMEKVTGDIPDETEIHVILDNYSTHKNCDEWLKKHENVRFHFTPTSASWLNQVEIWFSILTRKTLNGASFKSVEELREAINQFTEKYNETAKPFKWKKRKVYKSQLANNIANLYG